MSSYTHGSEQFLATGITFVGSRPTVDPANGPTFEYVYEGTPSAISALLGTLSASGARASIDQTGPIHRLTASFVRDPTQPVASESPFDVWSILSQQYQRSIFSIPAAVAEAQRYINPAQYRTDIEDAARAGEGYPLDLTNFPVGNYLHMLLSMGIDTQPEHRPMLRRQRSYSLTYIGQPQAIDTNGLVYTREAIIRLFGPSAATAARIPANPITPPPTGFVWGWYLSIQQFVQIQEESLYDHLYSF